MFGSLRIARSRMTEEERELYRGHFCGACHAMREFGGRLCSLLTNYDQTVLALVLGGLESRSQVASRPCTGLPFRRVGVVELSERSRNYLAALNVALVEAKLIDDVEDDGRLVSRTGLRLLRGSARRALTRLQDMGFPVSILGSLPQQQQLVEGLRSPNLEDLAAPSARLTGELFAFAADITGRRDLAGPLRQIGQAMGSFVYVWDAWTDRQEDLRRHRFNAIRRCFGAGPDRLSSHAAASVTLFLRRQLRLLDRLAAMPLGAQSDILGHLVQSLRSRASHQVPRSAEAGECDCGACDCCGGEACGACECCSAGDTACACPCECCVWGERRRRRKQTDPTPPPQHPTEPPRT